jgi:hypothetical protein
VKSPQQAANTIVARLRTLDNVAAVAGVVVAARIAE